jgi:hypothetical protein
MQNGSAWRKHVPVQTDPPKTPHREEFFSRLVINAGFSV